MGVPAELACATADHFAENIACRGFAEWQLFSLALKEFLVVRGRELGTPYFWPGIEVRLDKPPPIFPVICMIQSSGAAVGAFSAGR
jgi:hypothetical protein